MQPKMGKIDIDYQILHDAFFRYQTKPVMTAHGGLYYEGRELELKMTEKKPCHYSPALREALGMKEETSPPPWLIGQSGSSAAHKHTVASKRFALFLKFVALLFVVSLFSHATLRTSSCLSESEDSWRVCSDSCRSALRLR